MNLLRKKILSGLVFVLIFASLAASVYAQAIQTNPVEIKQFETGVADPCTGKDCYSLFSGFADALGGKLSTIGNADSLGEFINAIIGFGIGLGGVIAVGMIMYNGFLYMKTDNVSMKGTTKSRIINTVVGFVLLLSIYVILRTINPDLLNLTPGIDIAQLDPNEGGDGSDPGNVSDQDIPPPSTTTKACPAGVTKVKGIIICKDIAKKLDQMLTAAKDTGMTLGGGGYRSPQTQINLRAKNCGGGSQYNVYEKPSMQCRPPTAVPGTSRHEAGLAVDFTCNGQGTINTSTRPSTKVCFDWLKGNASNYGFYNLPAENWHWSIDGK